MESPGSEMFPFVDWEKIDPEASERYQKILESEHQRLKAMGREGFWATPHTLRAKAYYHIIHGIHSRCVSPERDMYYELSRKLFGEQKLSTHPVPEYMEAGEIPRYKHCLNKAGVNSVKKILLCLGKYFPEMNFCPILPALVSLILHFSQDEAECFYSVSRLICYNDPNKRYIDQTFLTYRASCMTFGDLANRCCRGIRKLIASSHQNLFEFYSDWIMWIFADLPFTYAIRVLDVYLLEGYKVLYRFAVIFFSAFIPPQKVADVEDFRTDMKRFVQNVARHCTAENLLERAFLVPIATRRELNLLFKANKVSLMQKGWFLNVTVSPRVFSSYRQSVDTVDFNNLSSSVVTGTEMRVVWAWIPERFALFSPIKLFSTTEHGESLASFYYHVEGHEPAVLIIKTVDEEVFGAFISSDMAERHKYDTDKATFFGTCECFVFTVSHPALHGKCIGMATNVKKYDCSFSFVPAWSATNDYLTIPFTAPSQEQFTVSTSFCLFSGGNGGHALCFQQNLEAGYTEPCDTFKSPPLCKRHFKIQSMEVWGIQNSICFSQPFPSQQNI
uniref:TBC1 domain family member 24 n=2 Tax=Hippocampus comes TaxID=109280 RepID=A0A3Q2YBY4_HIPCM